MIPLELLRKSYYGENYSELWTSLMVEEKKKSEPRKSLPLTEALVFDIVDFLLDNQGYGYSNEISYYIVENKPRRYTSREVVGILRNRPMFRHAQSSERKGGIKWRLDLLALKDISFKRVIRQRQKIESL